MSFLPNIRLFAGRNQPQDADTGRRSLRAERSDRLIATVFRLTAPRREASQSPPQLTPRRHFPTSLAAHSPLKTPQETRRDSCRANDTSDLAETPFDALLCEARLNEWKVGKSRDARKDRLDDHWDPASCDGNNGAKHKPLSGGGSPNREVSDRYSRADLQCRTSYGSASESLALPQGAFGRLVHQPISPIPEFARDGPIR